MCLKEHGDHGNTRLEGAGGRFDETLIQMSKKSGINILVQSSAIYSQIFRQQEPVPLKQLRRGQCTPPKFRMHLFYILLSFLNKSI